LVHRDGSGVVLSSGTRTRGRLSSLINVSPGWEVAVAAALGPLADSVVVSDISSAVSALTMLKREAAGQSELLVVDGDNGFTASNRSVPNGFTSLASLVSSSEVGSAIASLLSGFIAVEDLAEAESALRADPSVIAITREGDVLSRIRVRGGSSAKSSAIEISALIEKSETQLQEATNNCERIKFEVVRATETLASRKNIYELALAKLNESDARMSGLAEQMAVAGQNVKNAQG
jgi:chromosome segregation protein